VSIRQRLLENRELTLDAAFTQASSIDMAQKKSLSYEPALVSSTARVQKNNSTSISDDENEELAVIVVVVLLTKERIAVPKMQHVTVRKIGTFFKCMQK